MVELPGYVRDSAAALDALGGTDAVAAAAGGHAPYLRLRLRGGDPMAHPLLGDRRPARGLLLRISRAPGARAGRPAAPSGGTQGPPCAQPRCSLQTSGVMLVLCNNAALSCPNLHAYMYAGMRGAVKCYVTESRSS